MYPSMIDFGALCRTYDPCALSLEIHYQTTEWTQKEGEVRFRPYRCFPVFEVL